MLEYENDPTGEAELQFEAIAALMAAGREFDAEFVEHVVTAADRSMHDLASQVESEIRERVRSQFAVWGYEFNGTADDADEDDDENELNAENEFSDHCDSLGRRLWEFEGNVPAGATACIYHKGKKLREIYAPHGHFEIQAAMPRGMQTVEVLAIGADGRKIGSDSCVFTVD